MPPVQAAFLLSSASGKNTSVANNKFYVNCKYACRDYFAVVSKHVTYKNRQLKGNAMLRDIALLLAELLSDFKFRRGT